MIRVSGGEFFFFFCSVAGAMADRGTVEPQLDGDLRRIRSGGDLGFLYQLP